MRQGAPGVSCSPGMRPLLSQRCKVEGATPSTTAASGSLVLACVSFLRCCPWKLAPPSSSPLPSLGRKLLCEAHASMSVPSTEKCSSDNSGLTCGWFRSLVMNLINTSPFCSRSRFFVKVVGSQIGFVGGKPHEPAVQEIVIQLLHQLAFRPDAVE